MEIKIQIITSILISLVIVFADLIAGAPPPVPAAVIPNGDPTHPMSLINLGEVEGKSFFIEPNLTMNWTDTKAYCESTNLKMVSIESKAQADFLVQTLRPFGIMWFYSALHESITPEMMVWDGTNTQPERIFRWSWWNVERNYQYCGMFRAQDVFPDIYIHSVRCDYKAFVACQLGG